MPGQINPELLKMARQNVKKAFVAAGDPAMGADPAATGGAPMDPAMAGMDPAAAGGAPMDPAMMAGGCLTQLWRLVVLWAETLWQPYSQ